MLLHLRTLCDHRFTTGTDHTKTGADGLPTVEAMTAGATGGAADA